MLQYPHDFNWFSPDVTIYIRDAYMFLRHPSVGVTRATWLMLQDAYDIHVCFC